MCSSFRITKAATLSFSNQKILHANHHDATMIMMENYKPKMFSFAPLKTRKTYWNNESVSRERVGSEKNENLKRWLSFELQEFL